MASVFRPPVPQKPKSELGLAPPPFSLSRKLCSYFFFIMSSLASRSTVCSGDAPMHAQHHVELFGLSPPPSLAAHGDEFPFLPSSFVDIADGERMQS